MCTVKLTQIYDCQCACDTVLISISMAINFGILIELIFHRYVRYSSVLRKYPFPINANVSMHAFTKIANQLHVFILCAPAKSMTTSWKYVFSPYLFLMRRNERKLNVDAQMHERLKIGTIPCETKENPKKRFCSSLFDYVLFDYATYQMRMRIFHPSFDAIIAFHASTVRQCADRFSLFFNSMWIFARLLSDYASQRLLWQ